MAALKEKGKLQDGIKGSSVNFYWRKIFNRMLKPLRNNSKELNSYLK